MLQLPAVKLLNVFFIPNIPSGTEDTKINFVFPWWMERSSFTQTDKCSTCYTRIYKYSLQ